jgi:hypothetical protein
MLRTLRLVTSYLFTIAASLAQLGVVWYVLGRVTDRTEVMIVTLAGVLYVGIDLTGRATSAKFDQLKQEIFRSRTEMRRLLDPKWKEKAIEELEVRERQTSKEFHSAMQGLFAAFVSAAVLIWCLVRFFSVI